MLHMCVVYTTHIMFVKLFYKYKIGIPEYTTYVYSGTNSLTLLTY